MSSPPPVRFLTLSDGRRLAYAVDGSGPPLVCSAWWVSHVEEDWKAPGFRRFFSELARRFTVVRYDRIGAGLSDRSRDAVELTDEVQSLGAVIDHLKLDDAALLGVACAGPPAIAYAAENPARVSRLALWGSFVRGQDVGSSRVRDAVQTLVRAHWGMGARALADLFAPGLDAEAREALSKQQRASASADMSARLLSLTFDMDAVSPAERVAQPVLVVHRKGDTAIPFEAGRKLAASFPNATFRALDGDAHLPWFGDIDQAIDAVSSFMSESPAEAVLAPRYDERSFVREGEVWALTFDGKTVRLKDSRGLSDLAQLLSAPGQELHVGTLWAGGATEARLGDAGDPVLDATSLAAYRARLEAIEVELADAEEVGHGDRTERLHEERQTLARELRAAVGRGPRALGDPSERARKAVSARIKATVQKISEVFPELGAHLKKEVKTGVYCGYGRGDEDAWSIR